jgi:hypothetical protein
MLSGLGSRVALSTMQTVGGMKAIISSSGLFV